jgi:hypothetical protein
MTFPTSAKIKAKIFDLVCVHWPVCIVLFLVFFTSLFLLSDGSYLVLIGGAVGVVIFLPLFKLENYLWLYIAAFLLSGINETRPDEVKHIASVMGYEWLPYWVSCIMISSVKGAAASFVYLLLLYVIVFRLRGGAILLLKVPICVFFLLVALLPTFFFIWLLLSLTGIFGPHVL